MTGRQVSAADVASLDITSDAKAKVARSESLFRESLTLGAAALVSATNQGHREAAKAVLCAMSELVALRLQYVNRGAPQHV